MSLLDTRLRRWLACVGLTAVAGLAAFLFVRRAAGLALPGLNLVMGLMTLLCAPGLALDFIVGKPTPTPMGLALNWAVIALGSGLVWGTLLYAVIALVRRVRTPAA